MGGFGTPRLDVDGFEGIVMSMDWLRMPDGRMYMGVRGKVTVMEAKDAVGWTPTGHNTANWLARIEGERTSINLMGCQVRQVLQGDLDAFGHRGQPLVDVYEVP